VANDELISPRETKTLNELDEMNSFEFSENAANDDSPEALDLKRTASQEAEWRANYE